VEGYGPRCAGSCVNTATCKTTHTHTCIHLRYRYRYQRYRYRYRYRYRQSVSYIHWANKALRYRYPNGTITEAN
jgi:hypothetical protein